MRSQVIASIVTLIVVLLAAGCRDKGQFPSKPDRRAEGSSATRPTAFTGTLRGGTVAVGGETTGWRLEGDGETGGIDLDVSKVQGRAKKFDGQRVTVGGQMTRRDWPERGQTQVLVADSIEPAPQPAK